MNSISRSIVTKNYGKGGKNGVLAASQYGHKNTVNCKKTDHNFALSLKESNSIRKKYHAILLD